MQGLQYHYKRTIHLRLATFAWCCKPCPQCVQPYSWTCPHLNCPCLQCRFLGQLPLKLSQTTIPSALCIAESVLNTALRFAPLPMSPQIQESADVAHAPQDDFLRGVNRYLCTFWLKRTVAEVNPFSETASYQDVTAPQRCARLSQPVIPQSDSAR